MATPRQIDANRKNSQNSTGPKSDKGKSASALNHLTHGFTSTTVSLIPGEDPEEWKALVDGLHAEYQPATPTEAILVGKMCHNQWLSLRALRLQSDAFSQVGGWLSDDKVKISTDLGLLIRYHTAAERAFHKAHADLVKAQKERKISEIGFESKKAADPLPPLPEKFKFLPQMAAATGAQKILNRDFSEAAHSTPHS